MSNQNSGWPFGGDTSNEGLDYNAIFGGGSVAGDVNPFDALVAQAAPAAVPPAPGPVTNTEKAQTTTPPAEPQAPHAAGPAAQPQAMPDASPVQTAPAPAASAPAPAAAAQLPARKQEASPAAPASEGTNLIEAAFAKQEEAAAQMAAKSLFEKAPVFSYGSAKEDITDPAQTFEELRIAKSEDFPELSEGKRVSWSVEYGKVTKQITDPKGTTIRSVKEEIERSKAFLDGLKKAKEKNPDCLVKPRVTAQSKGIASYKGSFQTVEEARMSDKVICLIPSGDGRFYELRKTEMGEFIAPKNNVIDFQQIRAGFTPALPLIPFALIQQIISFFRCYMSERCEFEAMAHILWDREAKDFVVHIPRQEVSKARIDADLTRDILPEERYLHYADIHSHNSMAAKFSALDDRDEQATRIYIVLGSLDRFFPSISVRMSCGGTYQELDPGTVIEGLGAVFPREWRDNVVTRPVPKGRMPLERLQARGSFWEDVL